MTIEELVNLAPIEAPKTRENTRLRNKRKHKNKGSNRSLFYLYSIKDYMKFGAFALFLLALGWGFYVTYLYHNLIRKGFINTTKRVSLKVLNDAIKVKTNPVQLRELRYCRWVHIIWVVIFSISIILILLSIYFAA